MHAPDESTGKSLNEIIRYRLEKLAKIKAMGIEPFAYSFDVSHRSSEIREGFATFQEDDTVRVAGRLMSLRRMGKASFTHIQDSGGLIQLYIRKDKVGTGQYDLFKLLDIGDIIGVKGTVFKTRTGEITILVQSLTLLTKNLYPLPVVKEKDDEVFDAFADKEQRYRQRYLDLIVNPDVKEVFRIRAKIIRLIREFLDDAGFLEVETPILQPLYGGATAKPFKTFHNRLNQELYLRIADELYLKRLIIGGIEKVYEISKNFRNEGMDRDHNPEFTLLEFYQAYVDYYHMMDFVEELFKRIAAQLIQTRIQYGENQIDLTQKFSRKPMFELLETYAGRDFSKMQEDEIREFLQERSMEIPEKTNYGQLLDKVFNLTVEPNLVQPTFVIDHPKAMSPFAKPKRQSDGSVVERFELFIAGYEFANAFSELNDPIDQRERLEAQNRLRERGDEEAHVVDEDFLKAMEVGLPPTGGVGIGIDRVVMLFTGQLSIKDVILFPQLRW